MSRLNELSNDEIKSLEVVACNVRFIPRESRDAINHVLEIVRSENKDEAKPQLKVGDRVKTEDGMGTVKLVADKHVLTRLDNGSDYLFVMPDEPQPAEESKENNPYVGAKSVTIEQARRELYEIGMEMRNPECRKQVDEEWRKELAAKKNEKICGETVPTPAWQSYRMELAKAVAIAYAEKGHYEPWEIGAKAVEVANGVVDRLKDDKI